MGRRKGSRGRKSSSDTPLPDSDDLDEGDEDLEDKIYDPDSIEYKIIHAKHPLEQSHFIENKHLSPSQRAITCCIQLNGGAASEDTILHFLQSNWNFIKTINTKLPNNLPDTRILHINLVVKKKGVQLFLQTVDDPLVWTVNSLNMDSVKQPLRIRPSREPRPIIRDQTENFDEEDEDDRQELPPISSDDETFEGAIYSLVRHHPNGIKFDDIVEKSRSFEKRKGLFSSLPHHRRVRACLITRKNVGNLFENAGCWSTTKPLAPISKKYGQDQGSSVLPDSLRHVKISNYSVDQLWEILKEKHIYN